MKKVLIIIYSSYGHTLSLAKSIKIGIDSIGDIESTIYIVPETLSD